NGGARSQRPAILSRKALTKHGRYSAATKLRRERYRQVLLGPYFKGKLDLLDSLREPEEPKNSPEAERGSPPPAAVDDGTALTGLDSSRREPGHGLSVNLEVTDVAAPGLDKGRAEGPWQWNPSKETAASFLPHGNIPI